MQIINKTIFEYDPKIILDDYNKIIKDHPLKERQLSLQYADADEDYDYGSCGAFKDLCSGVTENDYCNLNSFIKGTIFEKIIRDVGNVKRARFMLLTPKYCYSTHTDAGIRGHIAIITNPNCYFVYPDDQFVYHIPADGAVYLADVGRPHTYINSSFEDRIHLVFGL